VAAVDLTDGQAKTKNPGIAAGVLLAGFCIDETASQSTYEQSRSKIRSSEDETRCSALLFWY
jgi:hypothetical protein